MRKRMFARCHDHLVSGEPFLRSIAVAGPDGWPAPRDASVRAGREIL